MTHAIILILQTPAQCTHLNRGIVHPQVHNSCFFEGARTLECGTLVANPPYIPAPDDDILMPALHGGVDGANLTRVCAVVCWCGSAISLQDLCPLSMLLIRGVDVNDVLPFQGGAALQSQCCHG